MACQFPLYGYVDRITGGFTSNIKNGYADKPMVIPCGRCIECRLQKRREWAARITHEVDCHSNNWFVTLTYDDSSLPPEGLRKSDIQKWLKRLRKLISPTKIRYFAVGEYGDKSGRAHYHVILFGFNPSKLEHYAKTETGDLFECPEIASTWKFGSHKLNEVTYDVASYCAKYTTKALSGDMAHNVYKDKTWPFAVMSRKPGIGYLWYEKFKKECWRDDNIYVNGAFQRVPTYYARLAEKEKNEDFLKAKASREKKDIMMSDAYPQGDKKDEIHRKKNNFFPEKTVF